MEASYLWRLIKRETHRRKSPTSRWPRNDELKARWKAALWDTAAPLPHEAGLALRYAVAYRMQERALGGVKPAICRLLDRMADDAAARRLNSVNASTIEAIGGFRRSGILSGPSAGAIFNNTEDPFNPQSGEIISLLGNLSDYQLWRRLSLLAVVLA